MMIESTVTITSNYPGSYTIGYPKSKPIRFMPKVPICVIINHYRHIDDTLDLISPSEGERSHKSNLKVYPTNHNGNVFTGLAFPKGEIIPAENIKIYKKLY